MEILSDVTELQNLSIELKRLKEQYRSIQEKKKTCEERILYYLTSNEQPGLKYQDVVLLAQNKDSFKRCGRKDKIAKGSEFLEQLGIENGKEVFENLMNNLRGSPISKSQLKLMKNKKT